MTWASSERRPFCFVGRLSLRSEWSTENAPGTYSSLIWALRGYRWPQAPKKGGWQSADIPKAHLGCWSFQSQVASPRPLSKLIWFSAPRSSRERSCTFTASPQKRTWGAEQLLQQRNGNDFLKLLKRLRRNPGFRLTLCWPSPTRRNHPPCGQPDAPSPFFAACSGQ